MKDLRDLKDLTMHDVQPAGEPTRDLQLHIGINDLLLGNENDWVILAIVEHLVVNFVVRQQN